MTFVPRPVRYRTTSAYEPPSDFWKGAHRQILCAEWIKASRTPAVPWKETRLALPDGEAVRRFVLEPDRPVRGAITVFHGLGGVADGANLRRFAQEAARRGYRAASVEMRGAGGKDEVRRLYTAADLDVFDAAAAVPDFAAAPGPRLFAGFSLGGGMMLRWLGIRGGDAHVDGALALCPTGHLPASAAALSRAPNFLYDLRFAALYGRRLRHLGLRAARAPHGRLRHATMRRLDEDFASFWAGQPDARSYYEEASAHRHASRIARPTLLVAAADDPFVPPDSLVRYFGALPQVDLRLSPHGGHVAFLDRVEGRLTPAYPRLLLDPLDD